MVQPMIFQPYNGVKVIYIHLKLWILICSQASNARWWQQTTAPRQPQTHVNIWDSMVHYVVGVLQILCFQIPSLLPTCPLVTWDAFDLGEVYTTQPHSKWKSISKVNCFQCAYLKQTVYMVPILLLLDSTVQEQALRHYAASTSNLFPRAVCLQKIWDHKNIEILAAFTSSYLPLQ